ncbi:hemerythrin domain-containing protein [Streptomyces sp. NPDC052396]|uniref:hemerythrin domain-containing protein n=1 Tax=Streptomyces sp. NPDC052396 TaxID=3365689 RepID=UPI0037D91992
MPQPFAALPRGHRTMLLAHRAMVRDLGRVQITAAQLADAPDTVRAAALAGYTDKLCQVIEHHHEGEDGFLWPRLRDLGADEAALALLEAEHGELNKVLAAMHEAGSRLAADGSAAAQLAELTGRVREQLTAHAGDEERELLDRFAPALSERIWKGFEVHMRKTAPGWTLRFMPAWLLSVADLPDERGGVPVPPLARMFSGWLERMQREAFGENY